MALDDDNPNEYDEVSYLAAAEDLFSALGDAWESGADLSDIEIDISDGLGEITGRRVRVIISFAS